MAWHVVEEKVSGHAPHYNIKSDADKWEVAQNIFTVENARLIAAAPELLEALENLISECTVNTDGEHFAWLYAQDIINKARGGEDATDN